MVFKKDEAGRVRYFAFSNNSYVIFIKQPWYGGQDIHLGILIFSLITFLLTPIAALIGWVISRFKKGYRRRSSRREVGQSALHWYCVWPSWPSLPSRPKYVYARQPAIASWPG